MNHHCFKLLWWVLLLGNLEGAYPPKFKEAREEVYKTVDKTELKVWIVGEKDSEKLKPAVVLFFGGSWRFGSPSDLERHARYLAKQGFICLLPDYRVFSRNGTKISACAEDAQHAFTWVAENAKRLGVDPGQIVAGGASSGGHLAACLALTPQFGAKILPKALILFNPPLVMAPFRGEGYGFTNRIHQRYFGVSKEALSPIHHVAAESPPTWIAHGSNDAIVPIVTAQAFKGEMKAKGVRCEMFVMKGKPHAFHYRDPAFSEVMENAVTFLKSLN